MLHIHRAERADVLADMLAGLLARPLDDPFAPEVVSVPTRGIERWLTQQLSCRLGTRPGRADGICANLDFPFPGNLVGGLVAAVSGIDPHSDPWNADRLVWPLLEVVDSCLDEPWLEKLAGHIQRSGIEGERRRFATVRHLADLYDRYAIHRPEMLLSWAGGETDSLDADDRWQAVLWRRLRARLALPSPAERLTSACEALRQGGGPPELPDRVAFFGLTRLPASYLDVLAALARRRDVHLFLLHPSPALWDLIAGRDDLPLRGVRRSVDPTSAEVANPLLSSWGRDAREMQLVLGSAGHGRWPEHHRPSADGRATLLGRIQSDVRHNRAPSGPPLPGHDDTRMILDPKDRSIQVHACHGQSRQVEVLRDALLHLLEGDPSLEPRDIVVMCPDIEAYAPLIEAGFGWVEDGTEALRGLPRLPVRLADRSLRQDNPLLNVVAALLELARSRVTASQVIDFASRSPVRARFDLNEDDLARIEEWVAESGVRWGLDAAHRSAFKLGRLTANTWRAGLDRVLVGTAMAEGDGLFAGVLPLDDVGSGDIELAGRFAELVDRLEVVLDDLMTTKSITDWTRSITAATEALTAPTEGDAWQRVQLRRILNELVENATIGGTTSPTRLSLADLEVLLASRLQGRPTRADFRSGRVTVCTLVPMRSVPHRVVCIIGLNDGAFPRHAERDGDDLLAAEPLVGDRDAKSEDRQLLLDALLAATEHLVVTYSGRDERSNLVRAPAVPLGELLEVIDHTAVAPDGSPARPGILIEHPLQPFDPRNFAFGAIVTGRHWGFDNVQLSGARALSSERSPAPRFLDHELADPEMSSIELYELERFVRNPVAAFLRQRLGITPVGDTDVVDDALPVELSGLESWTIGDRLLTARLAGEALEVSVDAERARGALPPGALAEPLLEGIMATVEALAAAARTDVTPVTLEVDLVLDDGTRVVGTVPDLRGELLQRVTYSRLSPQQRLLTWLRLLALSATWPERPFAAATIGRAREGAPEGTELSLARIDSLGGDAGGRDAIEHRRASATRHLALAVDLYRRGLREPLPLYPRTSAAWAESVRRGKDPHRAAEAQWASQWGRDGEDRAPGHRLVLGGIVELGALVQAAPRDDEHGDTWAVSEGSRLGRYALRLFDGLLDHERVSDR